MGSPPEEFKNHNYRELLLDYTKLLLDSQEVWIYNYYAAHNIYAMRGL